MKFILQIVFPIALLIVPTFLVGQQEAIVEIGFVAGIAMSLLALGSTGFQRSLSRGAKGARFYLLTAAGLAILAALITVFVNAQLPSIPRPVVQAQVAMLPPVVWGAALGFVLAAALTWLRKKPA